ncbi:MAG: AtpZ/AtpI family protein [Clostridiales bacterium]|nr:AtpZ/AtpI family protein [Clostridiales bacterium]
MKDMHLLVWITQLGLTVAAPLAGFTLLGVWIRNRFQAGKWVIILFCAIGFISAVNGFRSTLHMLSEMEKRKDDSKPTVSFNQHE